MPQDFDVVSSWGPYTSTVGTAKTTARGPCVAVPAPQGHQAGVGWPAFLSRRPPYCPRCKNECEASRHQRSPTPPPSDQSRPAPCAQPHRRRSHMPRDNIAVKSLTKAEPSSQSQGGGRPQHLAPAQHHGAELAAGWGGASGRAGRGRGWGVLFRAT
eukprot:scaffold27257_cov129-Isochrysis_galbana.AAC.1